MRDSIMSTVARGIFRVCHSKTPPSLAVHWLRAPSTVRLSCRATEVMLLMQQTRLSGRGHLEVCVSPPLNLSTLLPRQPSLQLGKVFYDREQGWSERE